MRAAASQRRSAVGVEGSRSYLIVLRVALLVGAAVTSGAVLERPDAPGAWLGVVAVAYLTSLLLRSFVLGVTVERRGAHGPPVLVLRNWHTSRTLPVDQVRRLRVAGYDGLLTEGLTSGWLAKLLVETDARGHSAWGVVGTYRGGAVARAAAALSAASGVSFDDPRGHRTRHAALQEAAPASDA